MKIKNIKYYLVFIGIVIFFLTYEGCDGLFPTQTKPNVPPDHNVNYGGFLHIGGEGADECGECHGSDLRGHVYNYNGTLVIAPSCYQCHGNVWERRREGGG
jgi:hypothetical protein